MIDVVLAAGYATRLYPLTADFPKPLLRVGGRTLLDRLLAETDAIPAVTRHVIVTNHRFVHHFEQWRAQVRLTRPVEVLDDGSVSNETRLGAVRDLLLAVNSLDLQDDLLVAAADNVLDFPLEGFAGFFAERQASVLMCGYEPSVEALQRTGVAVLDDDGRVLRLEEKPQVPSSHWAVPPFYIYARKDLPLICGALEGGCGSDAPGHLARYVAAHSAMYAWKMPGRRYDIGNMDSYSQADALFSGREGEIKE